MDRTDGQDKPASRHERIAAIEKTNAVLRVLKGETIEVVAQDLGVSIRRVDRWRSEFVAAGSEALAQRKDVQNGWWRKHSTSVKQWILLLVVLVAVISFLVVFSQRGSGE